MTGRGVLRVVLASVAVSDVLTGLTALLTPRGFYDDFPFGAGWVGLLPPYNEHLAQIVHEMPAAPVVGAAELSA